MSRRCLLAAVALALLTSGCSTVVVRRGVERRLEKRLTTFLGPARRYRVRIRDTRDTELVVGRARHVEITGEQIHVKQQFRLESLRLTLDDFRYEGGDPDLLEVRRSSLEIEFTDAAVNEYLREYQPRYQPEFRFTPDLVTARITYSFLGQPTPIRAEGQLVVEEGRRLLFKAESADVSFLNQPGFGEKFLEDRVNPILDLGRIGFPARLESVQVLQGRLRAHGTAALRQEL